MKKIYSLVLMAAMLLVGTNAWAKVFTGNTAAQLQGAIYAIMSGTETDNVIQLSQNVDLTRNIWVGTKDEDGTYRTVIIDLNGHNITWNGALKDPSKQDENDNRSKLIMFSLTRGELKIINSSANEAKVQLTGVTANNSRIFEVFGTYRGSRWNDAGTGLDKTGTNTRAENGGWFSHLEIGQNVLLYAAPGCRAEGIAIATQGKSSYYKDQSDTKETLTYSTNIFKSSWGYAYGVRVDFKGKMDIQGDGLTAREIERNASLAADKQLSAKVYGFSVKGTVRSALSASATKEKGAEVIVDNPITYADNYYTYNQAPYDAQGHLIQATTHKLDTMDAPFIMIHPGAEIKVRNDGDKVASIYAAGYAKWLIRGYAEGKTGMYVSSGTVDLEDAYVKSTADTWENTSNIGSANGGGSGVVLNSRDSYAGDMDFVVSGDTKIESIDGYAIEEAVNTTVMVPNPEHESDPSAPEYVADTKASSVTIEGGTIIGGNAGAIVISGPTTSAMQSEEPDKKTTVVVYGGTVDGTTQVGTSGDMDAIAAGNTHATEVTITDPEDPTKTKTVVVISEGAAPTAAETKTTWNDIATNAAAAIAQNDTVNAVWNAAGTGTITAGNKVILNELQMLAGTAGDGNGQVLTVESGATLDVQHLMMNSYAQIIVEAGGMLIVEGDQGITAPSVSNIILKASNTEQATFLINPKVQSNRHPNASVKMLAKQIGYVDVPTIGKSYFWHRFALPIKEATTWTKTPNVTSFVFGWNYGNSSWEQYSALTQMKPFQGLTMTAETTPLADVEYTFTGELAGGNDNQALQFNRNGYHFFGNSYTGHISVLALVNQLVADPMIDATVWAWEPTTQTYHSVPLLALSANAGAAEEWEKEIAPMNTFILKQNGAGTNTTELNYKDAVWNNPRYNGVKGNPAPRRRVEAADETTHMRIIVTAENGKRDFVSFTEDAQFSDDYENGYDGTKYMNENALNMYASVNGADYSVVATDNLEGKTVTINTVNDVNYTMTFSKVNGEEYAIRDNVTGAIVAIAEGTSYEFAAQPNSAVEGRFEIVPVAKVATAIDNTEVKANAKGIYTIMGQYVGEDFNALPAGIYVINGVKIVK